MFEDAIDVEEGTSIDRGSTFTIWLPAVPPQVCR